MIHDTASKDQNPCNRHCAIASRWRQWTHLGIVWPGSVVDETDIKLFLVEKTHDKLNPQVVRNTWCWGCHAVFSAEAPGGQTSWLKN